MTAAGQPPASTMRPTLVVGGIPGFVEGNTKRKLARFGLDVCWHWEQDSLRVGLPARLPARCAVVVYLYDVVPHPHNVGPQLKAMAEQAGALFLRTGRKSGVWERDFAAVGISPIHPVSAACVAGGYDDPTQETSTVATTPQPIRPQVTVKASPPSGVRTFEERMAALQALLVELRDHDGVDSVLYERDAEGGTVRVERRAVDERKL